jgi:hypothetical protein
VIDERGDPTPPATWRFLETDRYFEGRGPVKIPPTGKPGVAFYAFDGARVSFNSSTMVVRRELLDGEFRDAFSRTQLPDLALFVLASVSPYGLYLDDRRLTRYRYYSGNVTHRLPWLRHASEACRDLAAIAQVHENLELAGRLVRRSENYDRTDRSGPSSSGSGPARAAERSRSSRASAFGSQVVIPRRERRRSTSGPPSCSRAPTCSFPGSRAR